MKIKFVDDTKETKKVKRRGNKDVGDPQIEAFKEMIEGEDSKETYSYRGWLLSDSFMKRSFAVIGYSFVGQLFFFGILFGSLLIISIAVKIIQYLSGL